MICFWNTSCDFSSICNWDKQNWNHSTYPHRSLMCLHQLMHCQNKTVSVLVQACDIPAQNYSIIGYAYN